MAVTDRDERRKPQGRPIIPALGDDLGSDSGRIAERNSNYLVRGARHGLAHIDFQQLAEFNDCVAAQVAEIAARAQVHALFVDLVVNLVIAGCTRVDFVPAANHQHPHPLI